MKPLSIIVPTLNEEAYLSRLLNSIVIASKGHELPVQVIVVDGRSTDGTIQLAKGHQKSIDGLEVYSSRSGISAQRNFGASKAKFETIIFCDADMEFTQHSFRAIDSALRNKTDFIAMPLIYPYDGKAIDFILGAISYMYFFVVQRFSPVVSGMCIITTKSVHDKINGFDENISHAEDIDYGLRAVKSGARHHIFLRMRVKTSARRLDKDGRITTGLTWLKWHRKARKNREELHTLSDKYEFGKFN